MTKLSSILFRCDASLEIGFGHLVRCLALADEVRSQNSCRIGFALSEGSLGSDLVRRHAYEEYFLPSKTDSRASLAAAAKKFDASVIVVDVRNDLSDRDLESLKGKNRLIALLDDLSDRRFAADLAFYPPVPQVRRADWSRFRGELFVGWEWTILRSQFRSPLRWKQIGGHSLLITMGGSDPAGITLKAVRALEMVEADFAPVIVLGAGFQQKEALLKSIATARRQFTILENVSDMRTQMLQSDLALCAYGMTAFELAASGVPAIYLCLTEDHAESASALDAAGAGRLLGVYTNVSESQIAEAVQELLANVEQRARMSLNAQKLIDGKGSARIAEVLATRASKM